MPTITSQGSMSVRAFGFGSMTDGKFAIFAFGSASSAGTREKYIYSSCTNTTAAAVTYTGTGGVNSGTAAGNSTRGIFALGNGITNRNKYTYASCTSAAATAASAAAYTPSAAGNSTRGIFHLATNPATTTRNKYTYASCTSAAATAASTPYFGATAAGNSTRGIFMISDGTNLTNKYTYACDTNAVGVNLTQASLGGGAAGNSTRGIFALGSAACTAVPITTRNKYTYASCTTVVATAASVAGCSQSRSGAAGNSTRGIFSIGNKTTRNKYTYASDTSTATGVAVSSTTPYNGSAVSWAVCVNTP